MEFIAGFLSAIVITIIGAGATYFFTARHEKSNRLAEHRQRIYMKLLSIKQEHFWISSGDMPMPDRDIPEEVKDRYWGAAFDVIDELRAADDLEQAPAIIDALIGLDFEHEWQRAEAMAKIIEDLSQDVTPRVAQALKRRDQKAMALMQRDSDEWWRRRGKIEPIIPSPNQRERAMRVDETDKDEGSDKPT